jgi:hypothetical protein
MPKTHPGPPATYFSPELVTLPQFTTATKCGHACEHATKCDHLVRDFHLLQL